MTVLRFCWLPASLLTITLWASPGLCQAHPDHGADDEHASDVHAGGELEGTAHAEGELNPLAFDVDLAVWTGVVFLVLLAVLGKFAWGPIVAALVKREQGIADNIAAAQAQHEEARRMLSQYEDKLASAADEVRQLLEEARRDAEHTKTEILAEAKSAAQAEHDRQMREVRNAKDAALKDIGEAGANFAVGLAAKIVQRELRADDHTRLIREAVESLPTNSQN